ncbi:MAG TPA: hypothetical protein VI953_03205 [Candidatus Paceibacterota bacterium]
MQKNNWVLYGGAIIVIAFIALIWTSSKGGGAADPQMDQFAMCLKDKGAVFYGAFWCSHCAAQKALFGNSVDKLPYVECSTADSQGQLQICKDKEIKSYPTWEFPPVLGTTAPSRLTGEIPLAQLADKTGCALPGSTDSPQASINP